MSKFLLDYEKQLWFSKSMIQLNHLSESDWIWVILEKDYLIEFKEFLTDILNWSLKENYVSKFLFIDIDDLYLNEFSKEITKINHLLLRYYSCLSLKLKV